MKRNFKLYGKRVLALLLAACLVLPLMAMSVLAEELWIEYVPSEETTYSLAWVEDYDDERNIYDEIIDDDFVVIEPLSIDPSITNLRANVNGRTVSFNGHIARSGDSSPGSGWVAPLFEVSFRDGAFMGQHHGDRISIPATGTAWRNFQNSGATTRYYGAYRVRARVTNDHSQSLGWSHTSLPWENFYVRPTITPSNLRTSSLAPTSVTLQWAWNSVNVQGYEIQVRNAANGGGSLVGTFESSTTSRNVTGLSAGTPHSFRVRAVTRGVQSDWSGWNNFTTTSTPPSPSPVPSPVPSPSPLPSPTPPPPIRAYGVDYELVGRTIRVTGRVPAGATEVGFASSSYPGGENRWPSFAGRYYVVGRDYGTLQNRAFSFDIPRPAGVWRVAIRTTDGRGHYDWYERRPVTVPLSQFVCPLQWQFRINVPFGMRLHPIHRVNRMHTGVDMAAPSGTPVLAAAAGRISFAGWQAGYGNTVIIDHGNGYSTLYAHLSRILVTRGQEVPQNHPIGNVGSTGDSTGPHLHFEILINGTHVNPFPYLFPNEGGPDLGDFDFDEEPMSWLELIDWLDMDLELSVNPQKLALSGAIFEAQVSARGNYTDTSLLVLQNAIDVALSLLSSFDTAATQAQMNTAISNLNMAINELVELPPISETTPPPQPAVSGTPTMNSITVNAIPAPAGWTTQYRIQTGTTDTWSEWQNSNTFTGLTADTDYQIQARFAANDTATHAHSDPSTTLIARTGANIGVILYGDVNSDGVVNLADIILLRRYNARHDLAGLGVYFNRAAADVNGDGAVNLADIILVRRYVAREPGVVLGPQISPASDFDISGAVMGAYDAYGYAGEAEYMTDAAFILAPVKENETIE